MTKILVFGSQSDIGSQIVYRLQDIDSIELVYIHFQIETLSNFKAKWYEPFGFIPTVSNDMDRTKLLKHALRDLDLSTFDYIINCQEQPLAGANTAMLDLAYNCSDATILGSYSKHYGFKGLFINLSSFHVYGNAPNAMQLGRNDSRFFIKVPRADEAEEMEEKFGYDSAFGISEKMEYSPKKVTSYGMTKSLCEANIYGFAKDSFELLTLRLPYMVQYNIAPSYKPQMDRVNILLDDLVHDRTLHTTTDNTEKCVYDFLTPEYVAEFICQIVENNDVVIGTFNIGSRLDNEFSELEMLAALSDLDFDNFKFIDSPTDNEQPLAYYFADCRNLESQLEDHITKLWDSGSIRKVITHYLGRSKIEFH